MPLCPLPPRAEVPGDAERYARDVEHHRSNPTSWGVQIPEMEPKPQRDPQGEDCDVMTTGEALPQKGEALATPKKENKRIKKSP